MVSTVRRRNDGADLRDAMYYAGTGLKALADRTRLLDPEGKGVSFQLVAFLATGKPWGRDTTSPRSASLIEAALDVKPGSLFETTTVSEQPAWEAL